MKIVNIKEAENAYIEANVAFDVDEIEVEACEGNRYGETFETEVGRFEIELFGIDIMVNRRGERKPIYSTPEGIRRAEQDGYFYQDTAVEPVYKFIKKGGDEE